MITSFLLSTALTAAQASPAFQRLCDTKFARESLEAYANSVSDAGFDVGNGKRAFRQAEVDKDGSVTAECIIEIMPVEQIRKIHSKIEYHPDGSIKDESCTIELEKGEQSK